MLLCAMPEAKFRKALLYRQTLSSIGGKHSISKSITSVIACRPGWRVCAITLCSSFQLQKVYKSFLVGGRTLWLHNTFESPSAPNVSHTAERFTECCSLSQLHFSVITACHDIVMAPAMDEFKF